MDRWMDGKIIEGVDEYAYRVDKWMYKLVDRQMVEAGIEG